MLLTVVQRFCVLNKLRNKRGKIEVCLSSLSVHGTVMDWTTSSEIFINFFINSDH